MSQVNSNNHDVFLNERNGKTINPSFLQKLKNIFCSITVEPTMLLYVLAYFMTFISIQNLYLEKSCRVNLNFDTEVCDAISIRNTSSFNQSQQVSVQRLASTANIYRTIIQSISPVILMCFMGSWSDRNQKRKACILVPTLGEICSCIMLLLCTYFFYEVRLEVNVLVEIIPMAITGGLKCMLMGVNTYIAAHSSVDSRTLRVGVIQIIMHVGLSMGFALCGIVYQMTGFYGVFSLALFMYTSGFLYGVFAVKEKRTIVSKQPSVGFFKDFLDIQNVKECFTVVFKRREGNARTKIILIMVVTMLLMGPIVGEMSVVYLYTIYRFQWTEMQYSLFQTLSCAANFIGCVCCITLFSKYLKWNDAVLGIISTMSKVISCILFAFAPSTTIFFLAIILDVFHGAGFISVRSMLTKLVSPEELGKANSVLGMAEVSIPLVYGPLYNGLYKSTITTFPAAFLLLGSVLSFPATLIFVWLYKQRAVEEMRRPKEELTEKLPLRTDAQQL